MNLYPMIAEEQALLFVEYNYGTELAAGLRAYWKGKKRAG